MRMCADLLFGVSETWSCCKCVCTHHLLKRLVRILKAPHCAGASVERLQLIMAARSRSSSRDPLDCAPRSPPLRSRSPPLRSPLTLGDLEWSGCEGNAKLCPLPAAFYGASAAAYTQTHLGLDAARAAFVTMSRRHRQEESKRAINQYMSFVPADGKVSYDRTVGHFIQRPEATVFAYLYEPTVVHAFGRCDCRNSNDNCNHT
jgi:hypothetical protein